MTLESILTFIAHIIGRFGYAGIFVMMGIESTFVPLPSEFVIPPAGYLVSRGEMHFVPIILAGTFGSLAGALVNYYIAIKYGRKVLIDYGKYVFMPIGKFQKMEAFFVKHGEMATFVGRLIPGVRHYISFPAGLAQMNLFRFCLYTLLGAFIWVTILAYVGYMVGHNIAQVKGHVRDIMIYVVPALLFIVAVYVWRHKRLMRHRNVTKTQNN